MDKIEYINQILSEWDPLNVGSDITNHEYKGYIPIILKNLNDKKSLVNCLEEILILLDVGYDSRNELHKQEINKIAEKLITSQT